MSRNTAVKVHKSFANSMVIRLLALMLLVSVSMAPGFFAQPAQAQSETFNFSSFRVEGNRRIETSTILNYIQIDANTEVTAGELNDAYQAVVGTGLFESVEFSPQGGRLVIRLVEYPTINQINVEGNKQIDDDRAAEIITSKPRRVFNPAQVERDAAALTKAYQEQGRFSSIVTPKIIRLSDNRVDVVFEVVETRNVEVERISFVGNRIYSDSRLRRVLASKQAGLFRRLIRQDSFVEDRVAFDRLLLSDFYQDRGYVDFQVLSVASEFSRERNAFFVTFNVREGQQFRLGKITVISEMPEANAADFLAVNKLRTGKTYTPTTVDRTISRMEVLALRQGLNFLRVEPRITRNARDLTLDVEFALVRGPRVFVERIDIEGNATTLDRVIRRQFRVVEGDPFNPREIREAADRIRALDLFAVSDVDARVGSAKDQVIVNVEVEEQLTGSLSFGGAYSITSGIGITASFVERNFLGRGQLLSVNLNFGLDNGVVGFRFAEPAFLGRDVTFALTADYRQTEYTYTDYDTQTYLFRPSFEFPIREFGRLEVRYTFKNDKIFNVSALSSPILLREEKLGSRSSSGFGYTLSYDTRGSGLSPSSGLLLQFGQDLLGFGGQVRQLRSTVTALAETRVMNEEVAVRAVFEGGVLVGQGAPTRLPERFMLTTSTLRGFKPVGVGPRDLTVANKDALGGNYYAVARFETEFPIGLPEEYGLSGGLYLDVGSIWGLDDTNGGLVDDTMHLRAAIGFAILWDSALGPLRFNFTKALLKEKYDETQIFELTVSTQF
ncbi:MAG: outer membrane protein assembly factor BamA [Paracoccaceae bacterium]